MRIEFSRLSARFVWVGGIILFAATGHVWGQGLDLRPSLPSKSPEPPRQIPPRQTPYNATASQEKHSKAPSDAKPSQPAPMPPAADPKMEVVRRYTLGEALGIAHQKHPQLSAMRASMNAAMLKQRGINDAKKKGAGLLVKDLRIREQQSDIGLQAAMAEYGQAEHEVTYGVVRCYFTVVYAREQTTVARDLVDRLENWLERVKKIVNDPAAPKGGGREINKDTEQRLVGLVAFAKGKLIEAETGADRGRAALREAMGLDPLDRVDAADEVLPDIKVELKRDVVITHAINRRGEVLLAQLGVDVTRLEILAQKANIFSIRVPTFANGADIHARSVPGPLRDNEYKPGAIGPDMPLKLIGNKSTRVLIAEQYAERSDDAARQARSLIGLEAEVAYYRFLESMQKVAEFRKAVVEAKDLIDRQREAAGGTLRKEDILATEATVAQTYANFNQALYDQLIALANLERITAGGVRVDFPAR